MSDVIESRRSDLVEARRTITVDEAAGFLGISRGQAYRVLKDEGALAGVRAIYVGRRIVLPREPFEKALGLSTV